VSCLRKASGRKILRAADESWDLVRRLGLDWTPTTDGAVLPGAFQDALAAGEFARVPVMVGGTANEGRLFVAIFENNNGHALTEAEEFERLDSFFQKLSGFPPAVTRPTSQGTIDRYRAYGSPGLSFGGIITDSFVACSGSTMRDRLAAHVPTYGYEFNDPNAGRVEIKARFIRLGAAHDSELPYLFQVNPDTQRTPKFTRRQKRLAKQIGRYWGRFARTGNPNGRGLPPWARWDAMREPIQSLRPGGTRTLPQGAFTSEHQCDYWDPLLSAVG
jgi:para-nitrobenzyl esterase